VKTAEHAIAADEQVRVAHLLAAEWHVGQVPDTRSAKKPLAQEKKLLRKIGVTL
jgi:hypothetical protein